MTWLHKKNASPVGPRLERSFGEDLNLKESPLHLNLVVPGWLPLASFALIILFH